MSERNVFDTEKEDFFTVSNEYDTQQTKKSYASAKKYIDDYLKENQNFNQWVTREWKAD